MSYIDKVKVLLNIEDDLQDKMLGLIEEMTTQHFTAIVDVVPDMYSCTY